MSEVKIVVTLTRELIFKCSPEHVSLIAFRFCKGRILKLVNLDLLCLNLQVTLVETINNE